MIVFVFRRRHEVVTVVPYPKITVVDDLEIVRMLDKERFQPSLQPIPVEVPALGDLHEIIEGYYRVPLLDLLKYPSDNYFGNFPPLSAKLWVFPQVHI